MHKPKTPAQLTKQAREWNMRVPVGSIARWERRDNARDPGGVREKKRDDLVRLISDKLWGIR